MYELCMYVILNKSKSSTPILSKKKKFSYLADTKCALVKVAGWVIMIIASGKTTNRQREKSGCSPPRDVFISLGSGEAKFVFNWKAFKIPSSDFALCDSHSMQKSELVVMSYFLDF